MDIKGMSTESLVAELSVREEVKRIAVGPHKTHRLEAKYNQGEEREITSEIVLVVSTQN